MAYCKHVDTQHRASYEDFVSARNEIALDIGKNHFIIFRLPTLFQEVGADHNSEVMGTIVREF